MKRNSFLFGQLVMILCCWIGIQISLLAVDSVSYVEKSKHTTRMLSYNIRNGIGLDESLDYSRIARVIQRVNPDVVALQELDSVTVRNKGVYVLNELAQLTGMYGTYAPAIEYQGGKYGIGILSKKPPLSVQRIALPGREEARMLLIAEFKDYVFCCTHFSLTDADQLLSLPLLQKAVQDYKKPVLLAGDLNSEPFSATQTAIQKNFTLLTDTTCNTYPANKPAICIDYIYGLKNNYRYTVTQCKVLTDEPQASDHLPLFIDVKWKASVNDGEVSNSLAKKIKQLPLWEEVASDKTSFDWLLEPQKVKAGVYATKDRKSIVIANPLLYRTFRIFPNLATTDYVNQMTGESMLRAVSSEGSITLDGKKYSIGGLEGQPERAYIKEEWIEEMKAIPESFIVQDFEIVPIQETIPWARSRWALNKEAATGCEVVFLLKGTQELEGITIKLHISIYDKLPVLCKSFEIKNQTGSPINIDSFQLEYLNFAEPESLSGTAPNILLPNIHIESDYNCGGSFTERETDITEKWVTDSLYTSQRNYLMQTPCILDVSPKMGPDQTLLSDSTFCSFHVYEMPFDSYDRERKGLFLRHFYRTIAPWTTENPIFMHLTSTNPETVRKAVDQCAETGYEMVILSFGSGLNMEDISDENIARYKAFVDYAHSKGIEIGCYSLLASRWVSDEVDVINPKTQKRGGMIFGSSPCLCSDWGYDYFRKLQIFIERTGMRCLEHDGSYPGDFCASTQHTHHKGLNDSQWNQFYKIADFYHELSKQGVYMNVPDFYFLNGSNKVSIGYRETNWSLPRDRQLIHTRQLNYDCTFERIPSSLWSFVPLVQYHGGGADATLEPLSEHLDEYKSLMFQNYSSGIQACYRGPRLYDTEETKKAVADIIAWYKKYRHILNSDIIHLRRPDARDWDGLMHVDPNGKEKGLAVFYNPTDEEITRTINLPLYYTGLTKKAHIREQEGKSVAYSLQRDFSVALTVKIPPKGYTWYVIQ